MTATQVLISGSLFRAPEQRTSRAGRQFVSATIKVGDSDGAEFWNLMVFSDGAQAELLRLDVGDALSAQGSAKIELYRPEGSSESRISRTIFANAILPLRAAPRERKKKGPAEAPLLDTPAEQTAGPAFFSDEIPFEAAL